MTDIFLHHFFNPSCMKEHPSNVICADDHNKRTSFFCVVRMMNLDVNTVPMTFLPVVKDAVSTLLSAKDVDNSCGASREEWRSGSSERNAVFQ